MQLVCWVVDYSQFQFDFLQIMRSSRGNSIKDWLWSGLLSVPLIGFSLYRHSGTKLNLLLVVGINVILLCVIWFMLDIIITICFDDSSRMDRQRREEELKGRSSKKAHEAEQSILNRVYYAFKILLYFLSFTLWEWEVTQIRWFFNIGCSNSKIVCFNNLTLVFFVQLFSSICLEFLIQATSPQTGGQQSGGSLKSMKDNKSSQQDKEKDVQDGPALKVAGPEGEITAGSCR